MHLICITFQCLIIISTYFLKIKLFEGVGYGGNKEDYVSVKYDEEMNLTIEPSKTYNDAGDQYQTMSDTYYPKLIYQPSKPVTREILGDATIAENKRKFIREQR